jgi:hypothetical protein
MIPARAGISDFATTPKTVLGPTVSYQMVKQLKYEINYLYLVPKLRMHGD